MAGIGDCSAPNLLRLFDDAFQSFNNLDTKFDSTSGAHFQNEVKRLIQMLEDATKMVTSLGMFSSNEDIEEVATNDIRFFLLPAILGSLVMKSMSEDRLHLLQTAEIYFKDFLQRCSDYGITQVNPKYFKDNSGESKPTATIPDVIEMAKERDDKIRRYKTRKEMQSKIEDYKKLVENENIDEEVKRDYFLTLIKWWILQSMDELDSVQKEKILLQRFSDMPTSSKTEKNPPAKLLKPIIITKNEVQKKVYGLGYPSIPTMTIDEFYEKKVQDGTFQVPDMSLQTRGYDRSAIEEDDNIEKERNLETDDPVAIMQARNWDDWKDDNRRGWGNRKNKG
ncbi:hypothetical protein CHUAL_000885 [Chamberlinius hualienensis]